MSSFEDQQSISLMGHVSENEQVPDLKLAKPPQKIKKVFEKVEASYIGVSMEPEEEDIKAIQELEDNNTSAHHKMVSSIPNPKPRRPRPVGLQFIASGNNPRDIIESPCVAVQFTSLGSPNLAERQQKSKNSI